MFVRPLPGDSPPPEMDAVTDQLTRMADEGWQAVLPAPDGRLNIEVTRLSPTLFPALGNHFDGDKVGVVYGPLVPQISTGVIPPEPMWQRTDPPGTWLTLMVGFPVPLGAALLLTAVVWADIIGRRRITRARTMSAR